MQNSNQNSKNEKSSSNSPSIPSLPQRKVFSNSNLTSQNTNESPSNDFQRRKLPPTPQNHQNSSTLREKPASSSSLPPNNSNPNGTTLKERSPSGSNDSNSTSKEKVSTSTHAMTMREGRTPSSSNGNHRIGTNSIAKTKEISNSVDKKEEKNSTMVRPRLPSRALPTPPGVSGVSMEERNAIRARTMTMYGGSRKPPANPPPPTPSDVLPFNFPSSTPVVDSKPHPESPKAMINFEEEKEENGSEVPKEKTKGTKVPPRIGTDQFSTSRANLSSNSLRRRSMVVNSNAGRALPTVPSGTSNNQKSIPSVSQNFPFKEKNVEEELKANQVSVKDRRSIHEGLIRGLSQSLMEIPKSSSTSRRSSLTKQSEKIEEEHKEEKEKEGEEKEKIEAAVFLSDSDFSVKSEAEEKSTEATESNGTQSRKNSLSNKKETQEEIEDIKKDEENSEKPEISEEKTEEKTSEGISDTIEEIVDKPEEKLEEKVEEISEKKKKDTPKLKRKLPFKIEKQKSNYWEKAVTEDGVPYWFDPVSGDSSWVNPSSPHLFKKENAEAKDYIWYTYKSDEGYIYYYNPETQETLWTAPEGAQIEEGEEPIEETQSETSEEPKVEEDPSEKMKRQRKRVEQELIDTERSFVADLRFLEEQYLKPLRYQNILSDDEIYGLFANILQIQGINLGILSRLEAFSEGKESSISKIFEESAEDLKLYAEYIANQLMGLKVLKKLIKKNRAFRDHYEMVKKLPENRGLELNAFLSKPLQRLCKYPLLFKELLRWTEESDIEYMSIQLVFGKITKVVNFVNEKQRESENQMKVRQIDKWIGKKVQIFDGTRRFVSEQKGKPIWARGKGPKDWTLFLFDDLLLVTEEIVPEKKHKVRCLIPFDSFTHVRDEEGSSSEGSQTSNTSSISSIGSPTVSSASEMVLLASPPSASSSSVPSSLSFVFVLAFQVNEEKTEMETISIGNSSLAEKNRYKEEIESQIRRNTLNSPVKVPLRTVAPSLKGGTVRASRMSVAPSGPDAITRLTSTFSPAQPSSRLSMAIPPRRGSENGEKDKISLTSSQKMSKKMTKVEKKERDKETLRYSTIRSTVGGDDLLSELKNKLQSGTSDK